MAQTEQFQAFIASLQLEFFQPEEFLINVDRPGNRFPPKSVWGNIALTARVLDLVRREFDRPLTITSCYRAPNYNEQVGGRPLSQHVAFAAADFVVSTVSAPVVAEFVRGLRDTFIRVPETRFKRRQVQVAAGAIPFRPLEAVGQGQGRTVRFRGGVGEYATFTHVDTRGVNRGWSGLGASGGA